MDEQAANAQEARESMKLHGQSESSSLVEIGPRFVLNPIRIFRGSFGGQTLFQNPNFVAPNQVRALENRSKGHEYEERKRKEQERKDRQSQIVVPEDPLADVFR